MQKIEKKETLISKVALSSAIRELITRIMLYNDNINPNDKIYLNINNIWEFDIQNNKEFEEELESIDKLGIKYNQIIKFFEFLDEELDNLYADIDKNKKMKKQNNDSNENSFLNKSEISEMKDIIEGLGIEEEEFEDVI